ncbi:MAG TPA: hypothetical protein PL128_02420 [Ginsengibacter sp.]|nr:hypothetical protein [Ginsengibacter sp.]
MKKILVPAVIIFCAFQTLHAQPDTQLREDIRNTGFVHRPLPLDYSKSLESHGLSKKVITSDLLCDMESAKGWTHKGIGGIYFSSDRSMDGKKILNS